MGVISNVHYQMTIYNMRNGDVAHGLFMIPLDVQKLKQ